MDTLVIMNHILNVDVQVSFSVLILESFSIYQKWYLGHALNLDFFKIPMMVIKPTAFPSVILMDAFLPHPCTICYLFSFPFLFY